MRRGSGGGDHLRGMLGPLSFEDLEVDGEKLGLLGSVSSG